MKTIRFSEGIEICQDCFVLLHSLFINKIQTEHFDHVYTSIYSFFYDYQ